MKKQREKTIKIIKKIITICLATVLLFTTSFTALAAAKPKPPKKISAKEGVYDDYIEKHNIQVGDGYSLKVNWSSVAKADGYQVVLYWDSEGTKLTQKINVTKKNGKYYYTSKEANLSRTVKDLVMGDGYIKKFSSKKLSFCIAGGSCEEIYKISIKSYKKVNGKKIYSNVKKKKI